MKIGRFVAASAFGLGSVLAARSVARRNRPRYSFRDRVVLITGGSRGLGLTLARQMGAERARLAILARDAEELEHARQDLTARGIEVFAFPCDVRDEEEATRAVERVIQHYGRLDVLVNNAGVVQVGPLDHMQVEDFKDAMAVHAWAPLYTILAAIPQMRRQGEGRIVNIASVGGQVAVPHLLPYVTSKFALVGLSDGMRAELAQDNIKVTTVSPGLMRTGSHVNAQFKGRHQSEYTWFSILDALPVSSTDAETAARQIVEACRSGKPHPTITIQARLVTLANVLMPGLVAWGMELFNRFLPKPNGRRGAEMRAGRESQSRLSPSLLTRLADQASVRNNELI